MGGPVSDNTHRVLEAARARKIRAIAVAPIDDSDDALIGLSVWDLERFLDIAAPPPLDEGGLAGSISGRPQDMGVDDEPWRFEVSPGHSGTGWEFHVNVTIPAQDIDELMARLEDVRGDAG